MRNVSAAGLALLVMKGINQFPEPDVKLKGTIDVWWIVHILSPHWAGAGGTHVQLFTLLAEWVKPNLFNPLVFSFFAERKRGVMEKRRERERESEMKN